jgi:cytochrome c-type biogenesis protein CcmF
LIGIFFLIIDLILLLAKNRNDSLKKYVNYPLIAAAIFILSAFVIFVGSLIFLDFSYDYAYKHVSSEMDIFLRLAAAWSGQAGSYFTWGIFVFVIYLVLRTSFRNHINNSLYHRMFVIINFNSIALMILVLVNNPYIKAATVYVEGLGLNPVLNTFWNVIHPPIILLAYSLFLIPFSISLSRLSLGEAEYNDTPEVLALRRFSMALPWLVITIGLALGGYWAYVTLGWGGFWAWDPVETSSLVPWIFATVFFHNSPSTKEKPINFDKDLLATLPFLSILFATLVTRSGFLDSVHTFVSSPLIVVLEIYILITFFTLILIIVRAGNIQLFYSWNYFKKMQIQEIALYVAYLSILFGAAGILFGLVIPFGIAILPEPFNQSLIVNQKFFNTIIGIFGFISIISTFFMDFMFPRSMKAKIYALFGVTLFGLFLAILSTPEVSNLFLNTPLDILYTIFGFLITTSALANLIIPLAIFSMISSIIGLIIIYKKVKLTKTMKIRRVSQTVLHLGILIALLGALYSSNLTETFTDEIELGGEMFLSVDGSLKLKFVATEHDDSSALYTGIIGNKIEITKNGNKIGEGYLRIGRHTQYGWFSDVSIVPTVTEDIYVTILFSQNQDFETGYVESLKFQVQIKPMIWMLWLGIAIIVISMIPIVFISFQKLKNQFKFTQKMESTFGQLSDDILN